MGKYRKKPEDDCPTIQRPTGINGEMMDYPGEGKVVRYFRMLKIHFNFIAICFLLAGFLFSGAAQADTCLFILSGQSNMSRMNPAACFTPTVKHHLTDKEVVVVKVARGDTPISWWKQGGVMYDNILQEVAEGMDGKTPDHIVFIFMQGETDAMDGYGDKYKDRLSGLITNLRDDFDFPDMGVVLGRLSDFGKYKDWPLVITAQMAVAEADPLVEWVNTDDLNDPGNQLHYTDYNGLAGRFAIQALNLIAPGEYKVVVDDSQSAAVPQQEEDNEYGCFIEVVFSMF